MKTILLFLALLLAGQPKFDKTVHDFGVVGTNDGPLTCTFTVTNEGDEPLIIYAVVASCGCTDVDWTRAGIEKGKKGTITVTFANEDGPYPFDKSVTTYTSASDKPVILHIRGDVRNIKDTPKKKRR